MKTSSNSIDKVLDSLWTLQESGADKSKLILYACEVAERTLPRFEQDFSTDTRPQAAIEAARRWALDPTKRNKNTAKIAAKAAEDAADETADFAAASYAALSAAFAAAAVSEIVAVIDATSNAAESAVAAQKTEASEYKAFELVLRKYFPA